MFAFAWGEHLKTAMTICKNNGGAGRVVCTQIAGQMSFTQMDTTSFFQINRSRSGKAILSKSRWLQQKNSKKNILIVETNQRTAIQRAVQAHKHWKRPHKDTVLELEKTVILSTMYKKLGLFLHLYKGSRNKTMEFYNKIHPSRLIFTSYSIRSGQACS